MLNICDSKGNIPTAKRATWQCYWVAHRHTHSGSLPGDATGFAFFVTACCDEVVYTQSYISVRKYMDASYF